MFPLFSAAQPVKVKPLEVFLVTLINKYRPKGQKTAKNSSYFYRFNKYYIEIMVMKDQDPPYAKPRTLASLIRAKAEELNLEAREEPQVLLRQGKGESIDKSRILISFIVFNSN